MNQAPETPKSKMAKSAAPKFLGIGPEKTATSWLYRALQVHPEVCLPPMKEIGYFWAKYYLPARGYKSRWFDPHWFFATRRKQVLYGLVRNAFLRPNPREFFWYLRYGLLPHTDQWYEGLFSAEECSGDITPRYSDLQSDHLQEIDSRFPCLKIIITIRDPIEREWSRAKMNLCRKRGRSVDEVDFDEWIAHFNDEVISQANDYAQLFQRWSGQFGVENTLALFYDEIQDDAWSAYVKTSTFLGLSMPPQALLESVLIPANVGLRAEMPTELRRALFMQHQDKIERLAQLFPEVPYPRQWLDKHQKILNA